VDQLAAVAEVPVDGRELGDGPEVGEPGLLAHLPFRRLLRRLPGLDVSLREPPVVVGVPDEEDPELAVAAEDDAPRAHLPAGAQRATRPPAIAAVRRSTHGRWSRRSAPRSWPRPSGGCPPRSRGGARSGSPGPPAPDRRAPRPSRRRR